MSNGEHILDGVRAEGGQWSGYVARTNRGWAALPDGQGKGEQSEFLGFRTNQAAWAAVRKIQERDERLSERPVSSIFDSRPLYQCVDHTQREERDFTVAIACSSRHDGRGPVSYAVRAESQQQAWSIALSTHIRREWDVDCYVDAERSFEGVYRDDFDYGRFDLRLQSTFWAKLQEIVELIKAYDEADKDNRDADGCVLDKKQADHDHLVGDYEMDVFPMAEDLAHYATYI
ncbi:hypothetical protein AB0A69_08160 [Streptomyces sp. NPDC045431]|uniref:hypothetical protein n=1 Tax=Streptomyces sp. NPDC045431 TaxID=3155613 RepID=UPI0033DC1E59